MAASYPKPDGQKVTRHAPQFAWVELSAQPNVSVPALPEWRKWNRRTLAWWAALWARPQAAMWEASGSTLWALAALWDDLIAGRCDAVRVSAEIRQHEDRHGLSPKAMLQLRWRLADASDSDVKPAAGSSAERRKRLKVVA
jgi:hypothetical protein